MGAYVVNGKKIGMVQGTQNARFLGKPPQTVGMHDPVPQTGGWLKSVVQSYFNYYAVPGNLCLPAVLTNTECAGAIVTGLG